MVSQEVVQWLILVVFNFNRADDDYYSPEAWEGDQVY
jgi:hypothetical protein